MIKTSSAGNPSPGTFKKCLDFMLNVSNVYIQCEKRFDKVAGLDRSKFGFYRFQSVLFIVVMVISILLNVAF